jgi:hypothetical protein
MGVMFVFVSKDAATEYSIHHFATEASTIGIPPGKWPDKLLTDLGNAQPFILQWAGPNSAKYLQDCGCIVLTVYND